MSLKKLNPLHILIPQKTQNDVRLYSTCLEEHADDRHHRKSSVGKFRRQFLGLLRRIGRSQDLEAKISSGSRCARRLILGNLAECHVGQDLSPACCRHLGDCCKSIGHISELQSGRWGQVPWELSSDPRSTKHTDPVTNMLHTNFQ